MSSITPVLRRARLANSIAFGLQGFFLAVVLSELPQQKDKFGLSDALIAGSVVLVSVLAGVGSLTAERLAIRWSSRTTLRLGLLLIAITGGSISLAPNEVMLLVLLGCYGVAVGIVDASATMQGVFIQHGYGKVILASFYAVWSGGAVLGALFVAAGEALDAGLRPTMLAAAGVVLVLGTLAGPRLLGAAEAEAGPAEVHPADDRPAAEPGTGRTAGSVALRAYFGIGVALALFFAIDFSVANWSALYLTDDSRLLAASSTAALALAAYQAASLTARLTGDLWIRRFGPRRVVRFAAGTGLLGLAVVVAAPHPAVAILGFLIAGMGLPLIAPVCFSEAGRLTSGRELDALIARLNLFNYAGTLIGGGAVGAVAAGAGQRAGFIIPLLFAAALLLLARVFHSRTEGGKQSAADGSRAVLDG